MNDPKVEWYQSKSDLHWFARSGDFQLRVWRGERHCEVQWMATNDRTTKLFASGDCSTIHNAKRAAERAMNRMKKEEPG